MKRSARELSVMARYEFCDYADSFSRLQRAACHCTPLMTSTRLWKKPWIWLDTVNHRICDRT